ncbi:MAG TPA: cupin domain-containing protein [Vicinamibacterales bacterium]|jgi:glc operon protein GlcG|nr:cupin domain-containing protein [Vicinamibacterales bacterium]
MMRITLAALLALMVTLPAGAQSRTTYVDAATVAAGGTFVTAPDHSMQMLKRTAPGQVEVHTRETDIFYVVDGDATIVTGGTMVGGKETQPNQLRGTSIEGGETYHLKKGDAIAIPAGVPHWFKDVPTSIQYFTVKVITP